MDLLSTTKFLLWSFAVTIVPLNLTVAQSPPVAPTQKVASDPATDADFYLDKATAKVAELKTFVESFRNKTDLRQYPFRPIVFSKRDTQQARSTLKLAKAQIDQLADPDNAARVQRYRSLARQTERLDNYLTRVRTNLLATLDPKAFPDLKADATRLRGFGMMLANIDSFDSDPELAATIVEQLPAVQQEVNRITTKYDLLIQQETIAGLQLAGLERYFESKRKSFKAIAKQQRQVLPKRIKSGLTLSQETLTDRQQTSRRIVAGNKRVELLSQLQNIKADIKLLEAIDRLSTAFLLDSRQQLSDLMVAARKIEPADLYVGDDRDNLVKAILFSRAQPSVVNVRIPSKNWNRQTFWRFDGVQWLAIDRSVLQAYLLVKEGDDANLGWQGFVLTKDHLNRDAITVQRD